jgi:phenylacetate-coenzyme A ligase PaaK-like adenylate-forming protein
VPTLDDAIEAQVEYARRNVPIWNERLGATEVNGRDTFLDIRPLEKETLRETSVWDLVGDRANARFGRSTSGTTGPPTPVVWTPDDLRGLWAAVSRGLESHRPTEAKVAYSGYHGSHLAATIYEGALQRLGLTCFARHPSHSQDPLATATAFVDVEADTLVLAQGPATAKAGCGLADILAARPASLTNIAWWLGSSGAFSAETTEQARNVGIASVTNLYGASEVGHFAVSEPNDLDVYILLQDNVYVEIVDHDNRPVEPGARGRVLVSRIRSRDANGYAGPQRGSQILRLDLGDEATVVSSDKGYATRIGDIGRAGESPVQ